MPPTTDKPHRNPDWSRDELILALDLYLERPHALPGPAAESVIALSRTLNRLHASLGTLMSETLRNPNGVAMKLQNFRRFEPREPGQTPGGLRGGNRLEEEIWEGFRHSPDSLRAVAATIRALIDASPEGHSGTEVDALLWGIEEAPEGRLVTIFHLRRERSRELVRSKKERALCRGNSRRPAHIRALHLKRA